MTNQLPPELFPERPVHSDYTDGEISYVLRRILTIIVLVSVIGGVAYAFLGHKSPPNPLEIPTIMADKNYKKRPDQPGGIDIPHQDVQVYQELDAKNIDKEEVDHLLPPPEVPQLTPRSNGDVTLLNSASKIESLLPAGMDSSSIAPSADHAVDSLSQSQTKEKIDTGTRATNVSSTEASLPPLATPSSSKTVRLDNAATSSGIPLLDTMLKEKETVPLHTQEPLVSAPHSVMKETMSPLTIEQVIKDTNQSKASSSIKSIQLASLPDQTSAEQMMHKLQVKYASFLKGARLHVVRADLGSKGIYYRIQGVVASEQQARTICASLKNLNAGCMLVSAR